MQHINEESFVSDIVRNDYRTADVFRKYGINYCCGGKWPLQIICENMGLETKTVVKALNDNLIHTHLQPAIGNYENWSISFLIDFLLNVNHVWFLKALPVAKEVSDEFVGKHTKKFPELEPLLPLLSSIEKNITQSIQQDEQSFFPYIQKLERAYTNRESYASMFVKTMGKPLDEQMQNEKKKIALYLQQARSITQNYELPSAPCTSHYVSFQKLKELDNALVLMQAIKYDTLYCNAINIEKQVLKGNG